MGLRFQLLLAVLMLAAAPPAAVTQTAHPTLSAALLADPHFDPFRDPSKVRRLAEAPVEQWAAILAEPAAPGDAKAFQDLQASCTEKSIDAANDLMLSAFDAAAASGTQGPPAFVMLAGDLLVHRFDCRYEKLLGRPPAAPGTKYDDAEANPSAKTARGLMTFAAKTVDYIALQLHQRFPTVPVYIALGNNDSGCGDYQLDENDQLLTATEPAIARGWVGMPADAVAAAAADYKRIGSYTLPLPPAFPRGHVIVLDDLYLSSRYSTCKAAHDPAAGEHLLAWLDLQLTDAEQRGEFVWVLTHIPPGINTYSTNVAGINVCAAQPPVTFLQSTALSAVLAKHAKTVRVLVSGHTHVDEMAVFGGDEGSGTVAVKGIPSVSTVSGNAPAFVIASVAPRTGVLQDYTLHTASSAVAGAPAASLHWGTAYDFRKTYGEPAYTPAAVQHLVQRFTRGAPADEAAVANYQTYFAGGGLRRLALQAVWNQYTCHMQHDDPKAFATCVCGAK